MRIIGVLDTWRPTPHFYDLNTDAFGRGEDLFVPFSTSRELRLHHNGSRNCWGDSPDPEALAYSLSVRGASLLIHLPKQDVWRGTGD